MGPELGLFDIVGDGTKPERINGGRKNGESHYIDQTDESSAVRARRSFCSYHSPREIQEIYAPAYCRSRACCVRSADESRPVVPSLATTSNSRSTANPTLVQSITVDHFSHSVIRLTCTTLPSPRNYLPSHAVNSVFHHPPHCCFSPCQPFVHRTPTLVPLSSRSGLVFNRSRSIGINEFASWFG